jgi:hypothetical protein
LVNPLWVNNLLLTHAGGWVNTVASRTTVSAFTKSLRCMILIHLDRGPILVSHWFKTILPYLKPSRRGGLIHLLPSAIIPLAHPHIGQTTNSGSFASCNYYPRWLLEPPHSHRPQWRHLL